MLYVLTCLDKPDGEPVRLATRDEHLNWVSTQSNRLRLAGPLLSDDGTHMVGSLFIVDTDDRADAEAFNAADPYTRAGLWQSVTIHPFRQVFPGP